MKFKKSLYSVFEIGVIVLLFSFSLSFMSFYSANENNSNNLFYLKLDTIANFLIENESFRNLVLLENLAEEGLDQDWFLFEILLDETLVNYELRILNSSHDKLIFSCLGNYKKNYVNRVITFENDFYNFREIHLGLCY